MARGKARGRGVHGPKRQLDRKGGGQDTSGRWLGTYADMVTLVLAFFVILFSMSQIDVESFRAFVRGLADPFGNPAFDESVLDDAPSIVGDEFQGFEDVKLPTMDADDEEDEEQQQEEALTVSIQGLEETLAEIEEALAAADLDPGIVEGEIDHRGLVLTIGTDAVLFDTASTEISDTGRRLIAALAPVLRGISNEIKVDGHTDDVPLNRNGYTNWNLSTDRAVAVLNILHGAHGVEPHRLSATGYGEYRPRATNADAHGRSRNRRVEIIIAVPEDEELSEEALESLEQRAEESE